MLSIAASLSSRSQAIGASKVVTAVANAGMLLVAAHALSPEGFGVFGTATVAILLIGRMVTFGCEHAFMRLRTLPAHASDQGALLGAALLTPAMIFILLALAAIPILHAVQPEDRLAAAATLAAAGGWAAAELAYWVFLARAHPGRALAAQAGTASLRLLIVAAVAAATPERDALLLAWAASGLLFGGAAVMFAARGLRLPRPALVLGLVRYARWQGMAQILSALAGQQAILMLLLIGGQPAEAGKFSLALALMFGVLFVYAGLFEQFSAEVAEWDSLSARRFLRSAVRRTGVMIALSAALLAAEYFAAPWILPEILWSQGTVFVPLAVATLIILAHAPLEALLHGRLVPRAILESRLIRIVLVGVLGVPISRFGDAEQMAWLQVLAVTASLAFLWGRVALSAGSRDAPDMR